MNKYPAALFFDFDGVLVDSVSIKTQAFYKLFEGFGQESAIKLLDYHKQHGGISRVKKIQYFFDVILNSSISEKECDEWCSRFSKHVKDAVVSASWIKGADTFLEKYKGKFPMFIVSGTPQSELQQIISQRKMEYFFDGVFGSPTLKPIHVSTILEQYGFNRSKSYFIGDALTDLNAALETGLKFIGIQGDVDFPDDTIVLPDCTLLEEFIRG